MYLFTVHVHIDMNIILSQNFTDTLFALANTSTKYVLETHNQFAACVYNYKVLLKEG